MMIWRSIWASPDLLIRQLGSRHQLCPHETFSTQWKSKMTPEQIAEAQRMVRKWMERHQR